jgi:UDP-glucose 4-epimerase
VLSGEPRYRAYNLGTGRGVSVRELIGAATQVTGRRIAYRVVERRVGDPPQLVADPALVAHELGWSAQASDLETIVSSAWSWMQSPRNPLRPTSLGA